MSDITRAIETIRSLKGKLNGDTYTSALTVLQTENGLSNDNIKSLLVCLTNDSAHRYRASAFRDVIHCCIPENCLSSDALDEALLWMFQAVDSEAIISSKLNAVLEWVAGLLEFDLVSKEDIDGYYELYFRLLQREQCQSLACKIIHMLTRPEDVYRGRVEQIMQLYRNSGKKGKHLAHLIELFKTYKPELVPETVKSYRREAAFKSLSPGFKRMLELAQKRVQSQNNQPLPKTNQLVWTSVTVSKNKSAMPLIPSAMYVHLGSELYREKRRKVVDFLDKSSLACYHLTCELPSSILSFMLNEGGMHFLVTHNSEVHARFSSVLYSCLYSVFIMNDKNVPYEEREHFLKQLVVLEDYMQQGIPVVSRFLSFYLATWNGQDHQKCIFRLLERITLATFGEFNDCILTHLYTLFISGDIEEKVLIINTLSELTFNLYVKWSKQYSKEHLFLGEKCDWETSFEITIPQLIQVVTNFCELGILLTSNDPSILHTSLCFYEVLTDLQTEAKQELKVVPPSIFYRCLFSLDFCSLARACSLLLRYKNASDHLGARELYDSANVALLNKYSCDVWNCLINKKAFTKSLQGYILKRHEKLKPLITVDPDSVFSLERHPTMLGLAQHMQAIYKTSDVVLVNKTLKDALTLSFPELEDCLEALKVKYSEYHSI